MVNLFFVVNLFIGGFEFECVSSVNENYLIVLGD